MTVSSETRKNTYSGNDSQVSFPYTFKIFADADLTVTIRDSNGNETEQTLTTDYTVTGAGDAAGGNVIMTTAPASGETLIIERDLDYKQETDYVENDDFAAETHEEALDRLVMLVQQIKGLNARAFVVPTSDEATSMALPNETDRASKYFAFDGNGDPIASAVSIGEIALSAYWEAILAVDINAYYVDSSEADQGAAGSGHSVKDLVDAIGSNNATIIFRHHESATTTYTFSTNETIPSNIRIKIQKGAILSIDSGKTLTITAPPGPGRYQVFSGAGAVTFGSGVIREVYPEWWPNGIPDGSTDNQPAIQKALASLPAGPTTTNQVVDYTDGGTVKLSRGNWSIDSTIALDSFQRLLGSGPSTVIMNTSNNTPAITIGSDDNAFHIRIMIENLSIEGAGTSYNAGGYGIHGYAVMKSYIKDVWINHSTDSAIYFQGSSYTYLQNMFLEDNKGYGVHLVGITADDYLWTTSTHIESSAIMFSGKAGVKLESALKCYINNNTIESNGIVTAEKIGSTGHQTAGTYNMNIYSYLSHFSVIENNYFEHGSTYGDANSRVNVANSGSQEMHIQANAFVTGVGFYNWASTLQAPWYNYIIRNRFDRSRPANCVLAYEAGETPGYFNVFQDNIGMRLSDQDSQPYKNYFSLTGIADGLKHNIVEFTHTDSGTPYVPDLTLLDANEMLSGQPKARVHIITLQHNISISVPTPTGVAGYILRFIFIQDGTGSRTVTFAAGYKNEWSDTGNAANKISSIEFFGKGGELLYQSGAQSGYY